LQENIFCYHNVLWGYKNGGWGAAICSGASSANPGRTNLVFRNNLAQYTKYAGINWDTSSWTTQGMTIDHNRENVPASEFADAANSNFYLNSLAANSIDDGVVIAGINDTGSESPYAGSAPDLGAYEFGSRGWPAGTGCSTSFTPIADTKITTQYPSNNYGTNSQITVQHPGSRTQRALLRFDIGGLSGKTVTGVKLRLREGSGGTTNNAWFDVKKITGNWTETGVTWNNQPSYGTTVYGSYKPASAPAESAWFELNLDPGLISGDGQLNIVLHNRSGGSTGDLQIQSRESGDKPVLTVFYSTNP
jgi:hypothetical protein